ncbi:conserved unknown protein [Ectocarpus siliculosus]|uniref:Inner centromere protein ARK-binding domain-containing protein n=1 Tax=Ectocarpus siliculosus TaxID=2880 RepID=D7G3R5_ECTSI|nr:conserved unknown protein [Ectocarpus siliculosus]|eukprot:CBJ33592.1 conserved unknown protein [Ectocarpus siliculosus]
MGDSGDCSDNSEGEDKYFMSDESGSDDEGNDPALKKLESTFVPEWATNEGIAAALERQYGGDKPINPNKIFVDFYTCSLETIFDTNKKKWDRKSTGDWMSDRLTIAEKLAYDRAMGYVTINIKGSGDRRRSSRRSSRRGSKKGSSSSQASSASSFNNSHRNE